MDLRSNATPYRWPIAFVVMLVLVVSGCGASSTASFSATTASPTPTGPPTGSGSIQGDANVAGPFKVTSVICWWPDPKGGDIRVFANPVTPSTPAVGLVMFITAQSVNVRAATGSGATYAQREFNGTGVTSFGSGKGAKVDATLTEDPAAGNHPGTVGAMKSISLTVDCAGEQPGTANVNVTGTTPAGTLSGHLSSARVSCATYPQGKSVDITALTQVAGQTTLVIVGVTWMGITVAVGGRFYTNSDPSTGTASATGGHWNGDVTDSGSTGAKLHVSGDATCGSSTDTSG